MTNSKCKLRVSLGSDVISDQMKVLIHEDDLPLIIGFIKDDKKVGFRFQKFEKLYEFSDVKSAMLEFIKTMEETENL